MKNPLADQSKVWLWTSVLRLCNTNLASAQITTCVVRQPFLGSLPQVFFLGGCNYSILYSTALTKIYSTEPYTVQRITTLSVSE